MIQNKARRTENVVFILTRNQESNDHSMVNKKAFDLTKRKETVQNLLAITSGKIF